MKRPAMEVSHFDGLVTIAVPAALARDIAAVWGQAHAVDPVLAETRPDWHHDVIALIVHAARAEQFLDAGPAPVEVPLLNLTHTSPAHGADTPSEPPAPPVLSATDEGDDHGPASSGAPNLQVVTR